MTAYTILNIILSATVIFLIILRFSRSGFTLSKHSFSKPDKNERLSLLLFAAIIIIFLFQDEFLGFENGIWLKLNFILILLSYFFNTLSVDRKSKEG